VSFDIGRFFEKKIGRNKKNATFAIPKRAVS
jgi:hypothetical protein